MEHFNKLYISDINNVSEEIANTMVMCGSSNWDYYFIKTEGQNSETLKDVSLIEFNSKEEMNNFIASNPNVVDFSSEHKKPCVLIQN